MPTSRNDYVVTAAAFQTIVDGRRNVHFKEPLIFRRLRLAAGSLGSPSVPFIPLDSQGEPFLKDLEREMDRVVAGEHRNRLHGRSGLPQLGRFYAPHISLAGLFLRSECS